MKHAKGFGLGLIAAGILTLSLHAQVPSAPAIPSAPAVPAAPGVPAAPQNIWSKLLPTKDQCQQLKDSFCKHPMGKMLNSMMAPLTLYSGGMISPCCPTDDQPNPADLAKGADTTEGAVAAIKADEAGAKARRAEMRYLGTVDCHYWPEAEAALIKGLRTDKNECVRWEAALSLGRGCCCTKKTMEALRITVTASEKDGNPAELSERVKGAALKGLNRCAMCYQEKSAAEPKEKPVKAASKPPEFLMPPYYVELEKEPMERIVSQARQALAAVKSPPPTAPIPPGRQTVSDILNTAAGELPQNRVASPASDTAPLRPVPAGAASSAPVPTTPAANTDLLHYFKHTLGSRPTSEPPRVAGSEPVSPAQSRRQLPPTGSRDLLGVIRNSIGGN